MIEISLGKKKIPKKETRSDSLSSSVISELDGSRIDEEPILPVLDQEDFKPPIPYKAIFTSVPFWAIMICHSAQNWGFYTLLSELPTYMSKILHFDIKEVIQKCPIAKFE